MKKHGKKQKKANDIEASIPVSEFAEYCSALDKGRYFIGLDIGNEKDESAEFDTSCIYESKIKEMKKEIIGYKFKNESAHNKFVVLLSILSDIVFVDKYFAKGFYLKGFDINNQDYNLLFKFAKKHNLLDELFTPVYKEETELQSGKWYKTNEDKTLWFINSIDDEGNGSGYGFLFGQWDIITLNYKKFDFKEASKEYVESMLIKEAKKRGLKEGVIANSMDGKGTFRIKGKLFFNVPRNTLYCRLSDRYAPIFENGIWIELKKESNYKTELNKALDSIDKVRKALEKIDSAIKKIKSND